MVQVVEMASAVVSVTASVGIVVAITRSLYDQLGGICRD